ncbi:hypothetical protein PIB30_094045 [Stylosanthes scabra]|uniref:Uncharacterized protein n=1 Tax=Stylosanthes scabra TaxID=79078 RepID=A0ABU6SVT1_9FABA|nr:hypothetical protein [Stylosanthes scabra]
MGRVGRNGVTPRRVYSRLGLKARGWQELGQGAGWISVDLGSLLGVGSVGLGCCVQGVRVQDVELRVRRLGVSPQA